MRPILFEFGGITIRSYPVMVCAGALIGILAGLRPAELHGVAADRFVIAATAIIVVGLIGGRLWFFTVCRRRYECPWRGIFSRSESGAILWGGIVLSLLVSPLVLRVVGLSFGSFWDAGAIAAMAGIGIARLGCLLGGCCAGRETTGRFGLMLPGQAGDWRRRFPTQLMEMALCLGLFAVAEFMVTHIPRPGVLFLLVLGALGFGRFILEGFREQATALSRPISMFMVIVCSGGLLLLLS